MKLTNIQILNALNVLKDIREQECRMPINLAFFLIKNANALEKEISAYKEAYSLLLNKYAVKNSDGSIAVNEDKTIKLEDKNSFFNEYNNLASAEVNVDIHLINIDLCDNLDITLDKMIHIQFMFCDKEV